MILRRRLFQAEKKVEHAARDQYFLFTYVIYCYVCTQTLFLKRYSRRLHISKEDIDKYMYSWRKDDEMSYIAK